MNKKKLVKRIKYCKLGAKGLGVETVAPVVLGDSWNKMSDALKALYAKQYLYDWKNIDKIYENKITEKNNNAFENPEFSPSDPYDLIKDKVYNRVGSGFMGSTPAVMEAEGKSGTENYSAYRSGFNESDDVTKLETVLREAPQIKLEDTRINNAIGANRPYLNRVKSTRNNKYYESLIAKANAKYGTNFKTREDVAAFLDKMGAAKVDGILGPETEALLDFYYSHNNNNPINTRRMYMNESNGRVRDRTSNILMYGLETEPKSSQILNYNDEAFKYPYLPMALYYSSDYISPMTRYLANSRYASKASNLEK